MNNLPAHIQRRIEKRERSLAEAKAKFEAGKTDIGSLLGHLGDLVEAYGEGEEIHWGHAGSIGHLRSLLIEATRFVAGFEEGVVEAALEDMRSEA